jgi:HSP20 family protein
MIESLAAPEGVGISAGHQPGDRGDPGQIRFGQGRLNQFRRKTMAIMRYDPFRELAAMQDRLNRIFGEGYGRREDDSFSRGDWIPSVDIFETDKHEIVIKAEMPGLRKEEIDLRVENNTLTLRGERRREQEVKDEQYHRVERSFGTFSRTFSLPNTVDGNRVAAEYKDGVLTVTLPMREEAKPRQIQVQVQG